MRDEPAVEPAATAVRDELAVAPAVREEAAVEPAVLEQPSTSNQVNSSHFV